MMKPTQLTVLLSACAGIKPNVKQPRGDCFKIAFMELITGELTKWLADQTDHEPRMIHGVARVTGGEHKGDPMIHAWVEVGDFVIDHGNVVTATTFYEIGQIDASQHVTYTLREAFEKAEQFMHYGPWHDLPKGVRYRNPATGKSEVQQ